MSGTGSINGIFPWPVARGRVEFFLQIVVTGKRNAGRATGRQVGQAGQVGQEGSDREPRRE